MVLLMALLAFGGGVQPASGDSVSGAIAFKRPQQMSIDVGERDRLSFVMGFDGRCTGGKIGELWMSGVTGRETLAVRKGKFSGRVTGTADAGESGRATFFWNVSGTFTGHEAATVSVSGRALVRSNGKLVARCTIAKPAKAKLKHA
jgi:hypothetical protein